MDNVEQLNDLAKYYRDLLFSLSSQVGKHFVNISDVLRYGLTADLSLFVREIEELITSGTISFTIEKASPSVVNKIIEKANEIEDKEEQGEISEDIEVSLEKQERKNASAILVAIYRKQEFDPYNREVIIGFPLVSGKVGKKKFCAPLFYYKVHIDFDPLKSLITLTKDFEIPALNFQLVKHLVELDEDIEIIRQQILPHLYREDFGLSTIQEIIQRLSELVEGFRGITYPSRPSFLIEALELREHAGAKIFDTSIIINARRTNAYLLDDLAQLAQIEEIDDETIINTILSEPIEIEKDDIDDPVTNENQSLLLFPLLSNKAQRLVAVKAEKGRLLVIQGPPGTGKSQTIVNLICHLIAQGKTVLATSHQNKALEVITKIMPNIGYLAMSLLKGERESINELRNKIEGFHSYVSSVDISDYKKLLEKRWSDLRKNKYYTNRLQVRFSELKILEREQYPTYHKYHEIRNFDVIDASDSVPEGTDSVISPALSGYSKLLKNLREYYSRIENLLPGDDPKKLEARSNHFLSFINYCEIRNYDLIDPADSIQDGMDSVVGQALSEYSALLKELRDNYSDIEKILPRYDPTLTDDDYLIIRCGSCDTQNRLAKDKIQLALKCGRCGQSINIQDNSIEVSIENIGKLIHSYDWVKKNLFTNKDILDFCQQFPKLNLYSEETINYLDNLIKWTCQYCTELIESLKLLSESYDLEIDFHTVKRQSTRYDAEIGDILKCVENLLPKLQTIREHKIEDGYPEYPDNLFLEEVTEYIETLSKASSWWKWHLFPKAGNARKFFASQKIPKITYKRRLEFLEKIKTWNCHWSLRNHIAKDLKYLAEMGIPIKGIFSKPSLGELHQNTNLALKYSQIIVAVNAFPSTPLDTIKNLVEQRVLNISSEDISKFKEFLEKSKVYLETCISLNKLKSNNHFASLCSSLFSTVEKAIYHLTPDEKADKIIKRATELYPYFYDYKRAKTLEQTPLKTLPQTCAKLKEETFRGNNIQALSQSELVVKAFRLASYIRENLTRKLDELDETEIRNLYPYFDDYIRLKTIERTALKTLSKTCSKIKGVILKGMDIPALEKPDLVVDAFRLSSFIREELLKNPDDINEVATKISEIKEESRRLILRILDISRKLALKEAEKNPATLFLIAKLNQILKRKRKTYSFVQLRDQIDYKKLISVFPCWIMSIEDVARIFPLQAGLFDYLIVDEASQCNQATALHLAYRAKRMIVVGDSKQMKNPNTQFLSDSIVRLNLTKHKLDKHPKTEFFHGRNSLLDLAIGCQDISPVFLNEHFRCEPPIIEFSNRHFYDNNLKILTPFRRRRFKPCMEIRVINGAYDDPDDTKRNIVEAMAVIEEFKRMIENGELEGDKKSEKLTLGILSPFRQQASLLQNTVYEIFSERPHIIKEHEIITSTVDGFQGDERDVILYSFRYAPNSKPGTIHVLQREDEHSLGRLNVAFSRARRRVVCFISMPKDNFPKGLIKEYLDHVAIVQGSSYSRLGNPNEREKCQSEFEGDVFDELVKKELEVYAQVPCAGFFIDFIAIDKEGRRMAVECDGEFHYEEGELREEDYQRQDIIERYGWFVHRISSRRYYADPQKAIERLIEDLQKQPIDEEICVEPMEHVTHFGTPTELTKSLEESKLPFDEKAFFEKSIQEKIMEILSEESLPVWAIAQKLSISKEEVLPELKRLLETEWVIEIYEDGVKKWKAID